LLERHLDLARLATVARGERLGDSELSRLIDAAPAQVRELLQTEGYFEPEMQIQRRTPETPDGPPRLRLQLQPGPRTKISQVDLQLSGAWGEAVQAGRADAVQALQGLRQHWPLKTGAPFRNPAWADAKTESLARLRASGHLAASWSRTSAEIDPALGQALLSLSADPGPLFLSGELRVEGLRLHEGSSRYVLMQHCFANASKRPKGFPLSELIEVVGDQAKQALSGMVRYGFLEAVQ
jgi:translocation and assembly module TamA